MPLMDCLALILDSHKYGKDMITERIREVLEMMVLSHECSAIIQHEIIPKKLGDPGSFTLPFNWCLCDLGASVSMMPLLVAKRLDFSKYRACNVSLMLVDRSIRIPHGLLEDVPYMIGTIEEPRDPLILGRPFFFYSWSHHRCQEGEDQS